MGWVGLGPSPKCLFILGPPNGPNPPIWFSRLSRNRGYERGLRARANLERPILLEHLWFFFRAFGLNYIPPRRVR